MRSLEQMAVDLEGLAADSAARRFSDLASSLWIAAIAIRAEWISSGDPRALLTPNLDAMMASARKTAVPAIAIAGTAVSAAEGG